MAEAIAKTKTVSKVVEVEELDGVILHLTNKEAETLHYVTRRIAGDLSGPRGAMEAIRTSLSELGVLPRVAKEAVQGMRFPTF